MQTLVIDMDIPRIVLTQLLSRISPADFFARSSPLRLLTLPDPPLPRPDWVRVPFHPIHPDNHGNFHNQTQNLYVRADSIHPYIKVLLTLSKKMKFI